MLNEELKKEIELLNKRIAMLEKQNFDILEIFNKFLDREKYIQYGFGGK